MPCTGTTAGAPWGDAAAVTFTVRRVSDPASAVLAWPCQEPEHVEHVRQSAPLLARPWTLRAGAPGGRAAADAHEGREGGARPIAKPNTLYPRACAQVRQEGALLQKRAEAAEAELGAQRAAHRRDLRRSARELADAQARP